MVPLAYAYLFGCGVLLLPWIILYISSPSLRREMLVMSIFIGLVSVATAYYWWTYDWWRPPTITGTRVGIEDFLLGFASGGVMAAAYESLFRANYTRRARRRSYPSGITMLLLLAFVTSWLVWGVGLTSFWASAVALFGLALLLCYFRRDLFVNALVSGCLMAMISLLPYIAIQIVAPEWIATTYNYNYLSGIHFIGIPIEELIFWFLAGSVFGPFYEYWQGTYVHKRHGK